MLTYPGINVFIIPHFKTTDMDSSLPGRDGILNNIL